VQNDEEPLDVADLTRRVNAFGRWHYEIDLGHGVVTPIHDRSWVNRHRQRAQYFFEPLVGLCGGTLAGKRVLDLGCNAGFWSLKALEAGAEFVLGIDGREMHIEQSNLVMEARGIDPARYRFEVANVFAWEPGTSFDVVLCLGLLYHVSKPVELMERCSRWNTDLLVIDTSLSTMRRSGFDVFQEIPDDPRTSVESSLVLAPSRGAVLEMLRDVGYDADVLRPGFDSYEGAENYRLGTRRAFVASKNTPLAGLDVETRLGPEIGLRRLKYRLLGRAA
jgi:SAM-dependent methyltransferase